MFQNQLLTSDQWFAYLNSPKVSKYHIIIMEHAGGWNAHNFQFEWYKEKITKEEFDRRMAGSTKKYISRSDAKKQGLEHYEYHP